MHTSVVFFKDNTIFLILIFRQEIFSWINPTVLTWGCKTNWSLLVWQKNPLEMKKKMIEESFNHFVETHLINFFFWAEMITKCK